MSLPQASGTDSMSLDQASGTHNMSLAQDNMPHVFIPASVPASGPQFQQLPLDILLKIFMLLVTLSPDSKFGNVVDIKYYYFLNGYGNLHKLRKVSKFVALFANQVFYQTNVFKFMFPDPGYRCTGWATAISAPLPPVSFQGFLRRIQVHIILEDYYFTPHPEGYIAAPWERDGVINFITTVNQLLTYCRGARQLRTLTDSTVGCCGLVELDLHIHTKFRGNLQAALAVIAAARFSVKARKVQVSVTTLGDRLRLSHAWHPQLVALIRVINP